MKENVLLGDMRAGKTLSPAQQILLIIQLSVPAIFANISQVLMEYIDSSMVGQLGAEGSAAIGLVSSSTWLFGGTLAACVTGFTVQAAQYVGAGQDQKARQIAHEGLIVCLLFSALVAIVGAAVSGGLPHFLGGTDEIAEDASWYFRIYCLSAPLVILVNISGGLIQASGNMLFPSIMHAVMCALDVVFNSFLIFSERTVSGIVIHGAGLGVAGAALGTVCAEAVVGSILTWYLVFRSPVLKRRRQEHHRISRFDLEKAAKIGIPVGIEQAIQSGAQVVSTTIVSPLGTVAIAANSLAVTAESLCYMPGYGIQSAAQTLIGQSIGAKREDLVRRLSWLTVLFGMLVMAFNGFLMYMISPLMMRILTPVEEVQTLGVTVLRIEAFAEPFFAASIVAGGCFRGTGDTLVPSIMQLVSMWAVRLPIAAFLAPRIGLRGIWTGMAIELTFRGVIFLVRLAGKRWMHPGRKRKEQTA